MATIKSFTDLQQSKKLAEFLPLESADFQNKTIESNGDEDVDNVSYVIHPCWSLSALLYVLPNCTDIVKEEADTENEKYMCTVGVKDDIISTFGNNPIDACYEMILKLHELKIL